MIMSSNWFLMGSSNVGTSRSVGLHWLLNNPLRIFVDAGFAVAIFLTLSGYVLLLKYFQSAKSRSEYVYRGMVKRYPRLLVPALLSLFMFYSWLHFGPFQGYSACHGVGTIFHYDGIQYNGPNSTNAHYVLDDLSVYDGDNVTLSYINLTVTSVDVGTMLEDGIIWVWLMAGGVNVYPIQWTLGVEFLESIAILGLALLIHRFGSSKKTLVYIGCIIGIILITAMMPPFPYYTQYFLSYLLGMWLADLSCSGDLDNIRLWQETKPTRFYCLQTILLLLAWYLGTAPYPNNVNFSIYSFMSVFYETQTSPFWLPLNWLYVPYIWMTLGAFLLIMSILTFPQLQSILSMKWPQFLGRHAFSIYLLHYNVMVIVDVLVMPYLVLAFGAEDRSAAAVFCLFLIIIPATLLTSYYFTIHVDDVAIDWSSHFADLWIHFCPVRCKRLTVVEAMGTVQMELNLADGPSLGAYHLERGQSPGEEVIMVAAPSKRLPYDEVDALIAENVLDVKVNNTLLPASLSDKGAMENGLTREWQMEGLLCTKWARKTKVLIVLLLVFFIPCCISIPKLNTCTAKESWY
jgi:peptidoglycan/LPS O-acetylase OafA/YrhL